MVKATGMSYVEIVHKLKTQVPIQKVGIDVKKMRKTANGDLVLEVTNKTTSE